MKRPCGVVNPELLDQSTFREKWERIRNAATSFKFTPGG